MHKFIQTHFFHPSIFALPTKQKWEKLKYFISSYFSILSQFFILLLFHPSNETDPKWTQNFNPLQFYSSHSIHFGLIRSILSTLVRFDPFYSLSFYSIHITPIWSTSVQYVHLSSIQSTLVPFGPFCLLWSYSVHSF